MGTDMMRQTLTIAGTVARDNPLKFLPINCTEVVMLPLLIPNKIGVWNCKPNSLRLLYLDI